MDDEALLRRAEATLTEIKIAQGLSEQHAAVLAALRIRLKGDPGKSLDEVLAAAGDVGGPDFERLLEEGPSKPKRSLDDVLNQPERKKRTLDDLFGGSGS